MKSFRPPSRRSFLETTFALAAGFFAILAAAWPAWIETFGIVPDHGDGSLEWAIPIMLAAVALVLGLVARRHWGIDAAKAVEADSGGRPWT
jgi:hypothetical protein